MAFTPRAKIALLAAWVLAFFLAVLLVVLPTVLVNRPDIRAALQQRLGAMLGAEVAFDRVTLTLFPKICATVSRPRLDSPEGVSARAAEIDVCLRLLPLLRARVMADTIKVQSPEIRLPIAPAGPTGSSPGIPDPRRLLKRMAELVKQAPETALEVVDGRLELAGPGDQRLQFHNLDLRLHHDDGKLEWSFQGESDLLKNFLSRGRLETDTFKGTATFHAADSKPQLLQPLFRPDGAFQILDAQVDLDLSVDLAGPGRATATFSGKAPTLALVSNLRKTHLSVERFAGRLELTEDRLAASVSEFSSSAPRASLELAFAIDEKADPRIDIDLKGRADLAGARDLTLALLQEVPEARLVCDIVRSGEVSPIHVNLHGDSWDRLAELNSLRIEGHLENGGLYLPWIDLDLSEVSGKVLIAAGILDGRDLKARYRETRAENGTLRVGLSSADPVLELDIFTRAELSPLPSLLARWVPDPGFRREVALLQEFSGTAQGTLRLAGTHTDLDVSVQASALDIQARHQLIVYPLRFQGGEFAYEKDSIRLNGVEVSIGDSKLLKHDLTMRLDGDLPFASSSPRAVVDLAQMHALLRDRPPFSELHRLEGLLTFIDWQLSGQALAPSTWRLISAGTLQDAALESALLPGPLSLPAGRFDLRDRTIRYEAAKGSVNQSDIKGLSVEADWTGTAQVQFRALEADVSMADIFQIMRSFPKTASLASALAPVSGAARMRDVVYRMRLFPDGPAIDRFAAVLKEAVITSAAVDFPLTLGTGGAAWQDSKLDFQISNASLGRSQARNLSVIGHWGAGGGLELRADDIVVECSEIFPRILSLPGMESLREDVKGLQGTASLSGVRLNNAFSGPGRWRLQAAAALKEIVITTAFLEEPIEIPAARLTAADTDTNEGSVTELRIESARVRIGADAAVVYGDVAMSPAETSLDLDVVADSLDWNEIQKIADRIAARRSGESRPVRGRVGLRAENFVIDRYLSRPFYADAAITPGGVHVLLERVGFCGMTLIGRVGFDGPMVDIHLVPVVEGMALDSVVSCLTAEKSRMTGTFNLSGQLLAKAPREELVKALKGELTVVSQDGSILQSRFFARLLSLLNLTEIYRGKLPDFFSQGLDYKRSAALIEIKEGTVYVNDWSIEGRTLWMGSRGEIDIASQKIDFTVMVSPFKTVDRIINSIPGLRWILGGRLVAIPIKATGDMDDPNVVALSPSAVGTSILEMLQRTLMLPIEIIQPLVPGLAPPENGTITR
jgi:hypothetical protein